MGTARHATEADVTSIVALVNRAYQAEAFFVSGDRINAATVREYLGTGTILVVDDGRGGIAGCVYVQAAAGRGYFGLLAVEPSLQGRGIARSLVGLAEQFARDAGATVMDITVVNVRTELIDTYRRMGYTPTGTAPYEHRPVLQPVHFVLMEKRLAKAEG